MSKNHTIVKFLGRRDYQRTWDKMKYFTHNRDTETSDEMWITEHAAVFTQGLNGKAEHLLDTGNIPVIQIDRGGQVTYHGPGQLVLYCLVDIQRLGLGIRAFITRIEMSIIEYLGQNGLEAVARVNAPGVYVDESKIAALGLRIRKGCCYHGLSLNINMDLRPFKCINPCGYEGLSVTQLADFGINPGLEQAGRELAGLLVRNMKGG